MKNIEIIPLTESESGQLTGGFSSASGAVDGVNAIRNRNCSLPTAWFNANCGCQYCNSGSGEDDEKEGDEKPP